MKTILFNSSMPRSGSELLQVILHQNPKIYASSTSPAVNMLCQLREVTASQEVQSLPEEMMKKAFGGSFRGAVHGYYDEITDRPIVVDKSRGWSNHYNWMQQVFEGNKTICMVRDLRGIVASMERSYQKNLGSADCSKMPQTLAKRVPFWCDMEFSGKGGGPSTGIPPVGTALATMLGVIQEGTADGILFVKYEDLCAKPATEMKKIYKHLGIKTTFKHDFNKLVKEIPEKPGAFGVFGNHEVRNKLEAPAKWDDVLTQEISDEIRKRFDWYYEGLGY